VLFGQELTVEFKFEENKEFVRDVLDKQHKLRLMPDGWTTVEKLPDSWPSFAYQRKVNGEGVPSNRVMSLFQVDVGGKDGRAGDELLSRARNMATKLAESNAR